MLKWRLIGKLLKQMFLFNFFHEFEEFCEIFLVCLSYFVLGNQKILKICK